MELPKSSQKYGVLIIGTYNSTKVILFKHRIQQTWMSPFDQKKSNSDICGGNQKQVNLDHFFNIL
jgi:hypothetical protein